VSAAAFEEDLGHAFHIVDEDFGVAFGVLGFAVVAFQSFSVSLL
jgi:hypothetical protein